MRVPTLNGARLKERGINPDYSNLDYSDGTSTLTKGIGQLSDGLSDVSEMIRTKVAKAKAEANAITVTEADTEFQNAATVETVGDSSSDSFTLDLTAPPGTPGAEPKAKTGYFSTTGKDALDTKPVLDKLEEARQDIATKRFVDPAERAKWLARSNGTLADYHRQIETHAAKQRDVVKMDALEGKLSTTLQAIKNDSDGTSSQGLADSAEESIRELARSKEGADAAVLKWRSDVVKTRIATLLTAGKVDLAEGQYEAAKEVLGAKESENIVDAIKLAKTTRDVKSLDKEAQTAVDQAIATATSGEGKPNLQQIDEIVATVPPGPMRDEMARRLGPAKERAARRWKEKVEAYAESAGGTFEKTLDINAIETKTKVWLQENASEEWKKIRHDAESHESHQRARSSNNRQALREQRDLDQIAINDFVSEHPDPVERSQANVDAWLRGKGVSPLGISRVKLKQTEAINTVRSGDAVGEAEFVKDVQARTIGILPTGTSKEAKLDRSRREAEIAAQAVQAYQSMRLEAKGKPSAAKVATEAARLTVAEAVKFTNKKLGIKEPVTTKLKPGRYIDRSGKAWIVDAQGGKTPE